MNATALTRRALQAAAPGTRGGQPAWRAPLAVLGAGLAACLLLPEQQGLLTRLFMMALLVLSLDLVVGIAGLAVGMLAGGAVAAVSGAFLLRYRGFTFLMLTVAVAQILHSVAQKARAWTGGDDGLSGFVMGPVLGRFEFDLEGRVAALYALGVLVVLFWVARRVVQSPFGLAVRGIHENRARMAALGTPVHRRLLAMYAVAGAMAGAAGAVNAQTTAVVGLDSLSFALSAEVLVMLVLGGAGRLWGAIAGAAVFVLLHHTASSINPYHWLFVVGGLLMAVVFVSPASAWAWLRRRAGAAT